MHIGYGKFFSLLMIPVLPLCMANVKDTLKNQYSTYLEQTENILVDTNIAKAEGTKNDITGENALDLVKKRVASNFEKVFYEDEVQGACDVPYYYQLPGHTFYLVCEDMKEDKYLIRLYEFVIDDESNQIGHTYTYGFYSVDRKTSEVSDGLKE